jgi:hypothetical protein
MPTLVDRVRELSIVPPREGGKFDEWLRQKDVHSFLAANAAEDDIVIYACLEHVLIKTVVVPCDDKVGFDLDELQKWELIDDQWSMNWGMNDPAVWLEAPCDHEPTPALRRAEPLIFSRSFDGFEGEKQYFQLSQKFEHVFDLHYVRHKKAFCKLDENGDVQSVVQINNIEDSDPKFPGTVIFASRKILDEYLLSSRAVALRAFDFTRLDRRFHGWGEQRNETKCENGEFGYRLTIEAGVGSYLRGVQVVRPLETTSQFHHRLTHRHEGKKYQSFITWDWKNKIITDVSCAPGATANYFTKSNLPFETSPVFFRPDVLQRYKSDPKKYTLRERSIDCRGGWSLKTFDINEVGQVHTYIVYLRDLPHSEQLYWKAFNERPKASISKRAQTTDFEGQFHLDYNPLQSIFTLIDRLSASAAPWWSLKAADLPSKVALPDYGLK